MKCGLDVLPEGLWSWDPRLVLPDHPAPPRVLQQQRSPNPRAKGA